MNFSYAKLGSNTYVRQSDGTYKLSGALTSPFSGTVDNAAGRFLPSPYTRKSPENIFDQMFAGRTQYVVSAADLQSPWVSGVWGINFDDPYPDTNFVAIATVEDPNFSPPYSVCNVSAIQKTAGGVTGRLTFPAGLGQVGHVLTIHVICIHD